ncbi:MAG: hypothetical protein ACYC9M_09940 [Desulfobulbaceae bacterium]
MNSRPAILLLVTVALLYGFLQWQLPHQAFWSNDGGEKLVQVKALVASRFAIPALPYDPLGLEPAGSFEFAPFLPGHARVVDGRLLSVVPVYFPLLSALPYSFWGHGGLYLLPLLSTVLALYSLLLLARKFGDDTTAPLIVATAGLASPLFFYSLTFWEHTLAACLATGGILLLHHGCCAGSGRINGRTIAAAFLMTLAAWLRGEVFILLLACGLAMLYCRGYRRLLPSFILGISAGLLPYALINHQVYATAASPQLPETGAALDFLATLPARWHDVTVYLLTGFLDHPLLNRLLFLLSIGPALPVYFLRQCSTRRDGLILAWCVLLCLISLVTLGRLFFLDSPLSSSMTILGLFGSLPYLPLALVRQDPMDPEQSASLRFLALIALLALAGLCLGLPSRGGLQWGPRYALPLMPLLILLAVTGFTRLRQGLTRPVARRVCTALFLLLLLTGTGIQTFGVSLLFAKKQVTMANMEKIRSMAPRVIITDTWWVPEDNGELYGEYPFYAFYTYAKMGRLLTLLAGKGEREVLLVSAADYRDFIARQPGLAVTSFQQTTHSGMSMFNLSLHTIRLGQP